MGVSTRALQNLFVLGSKNATTKDFELKILICFNSLIIIKLWVPLHWTPHNFCIPFSYWAIQAALEALGGGLYMFFELQKQKENV